MEIIHRCIYFASFSGVKSFSYNDEIFSSEDQYAHQLTTRNKSQAFTMYEKMYEQKAHHHNYYDDGTHLLRLEYKLLPIKIRDILAKLSEIMMLDIPQQVDLKRSLDTVLDTVQYLVSYFVYMTYTFLQ